MMSTEPNGTMTTLANITETPRNGCILWDVHEWERVYLPPYMFFIFVLGFIENLFVISILILHKSRCTVTEIYLGNMAVADLIFISGLPFWAISVANNYYWPFGGFMCVASSSFFWLNLYSNIYFLMMVSIERYLALVKATSIGRLRRPWWAKVNCGIIWLFAVVLNVPYGVFQEVMFIQDLNTTACVSAPPTTWHIVSNVLINVLGFLVPLIVTSFCTFQIIRFLKNNSMRQFKKVNRERKATRLVLTVFLVFIVCWLPYNVSMFINMLPRFNVSLSCMMTSVHSIVYIISLFLVYSNSCINPVIYSMLGDRFRQKAREILYSRLLCKGPDRRRASFQADELVKSTQMNHH